MRGRLGAGDRTGTTDTPISTSVLCARGECVGDVGRVRRYPDVGLAELAPRDAGPQRGPGAHHDRGDVQHDLVDEPLVDGLRDYVIGVPSSPRPARGPAFGPVTKPSRLIEMSAITLVIFSLLDQPGC